MLKFNIAIDVITANKKWSCCQYESQGILCFSYFYLDLMWWNCDVDDDGYGDMFVFDDDAYVV